MSGPSAKQLSIMLDGVRSLHEADTLEELRGSMLDLVGRLLPTEHIAYNEIDLELERVFTRFNLPDMADAYLRYSATFERLMHEHPILGFTTENPQAPAQRLSDFISQPGLRDLALYQEVYRNVDTNYQTIVDLGEPGRTVCALAVNRWGEDFEDAELAMLRILQPHLRQAFRACRERFLVDGFLSGTPTEALFDRVMDLGLTEREAEVCFWLAQGKSNQEIGELLKISPLTAKKHGENIYRKLGASGRMEVVRRVLQALRNGGAI